MKRNKVEKQNLSSKKLLEDINRITNEDNYDHETPMDVYHASHGSTSQEHDNKHMHNYTTKQVLQLCQAKINKHGVESVVNHLASMN